MKGSAALESTLWALKYSRSHIEKIFEALAALIKEKGPEILSDVNVESVRVYLYNITEMNTDEIQREYLDKIDSPELKEAFMSTAQILIQQGKEEEKHFLAKMMKKEGADEIFISRVTGFSLDELKTILKSAPKL